MQLQKDIEWEVSNTGSAVIDTNTEFLRAYKPGKVNVIAKTTDGSGVKATFTVIIKPSKVSNLKIKRTGRKKIKVGWYNVIMHPDISFNMVEESQLPEPNIEEFLQERVQELYQR